MLGVGEKLPDFKIMGVKPGFNNHEEKGVSAFEPVNQTSFPGKWKVIFFYPKDFTFVCPTEIAEFARLNKEFADRDAVVLGGSVDNEFSKLAWRRSHPDLDKLPMSEVIEVEHQYELKRTKDDIIDEIIRRAGVATLRRIFEDAGLDEPEDGK